jgi:hypothetical protein
VKHLLLALAAILATASAKSHASDQFCPKQQSLPTATGQPSILVIGDSISIDYTSTIQRALGARYDVVHNPCNAMNSTWTREQIDYWLGSRASFEAITWNNGLWDTVDSDPTSNATYEANLHAIAAKIKAKTAHPLFVLTTEVLPGTPNQNNADVIQKNMIAVAVMAAEGIPVLDLYKVSQGLMHASPTDLHYTPAGSAALGAAVVAELTTRYGITANPTRGTDN